MTQPDPVPAPPAEAPERDTFARRVADAGHHLDALRGKTGRRGELAQLRRMALAPEAVPPAVFWDVLFRVGATDDRREERLWRRLLPLMARFPFQPQSRLGAALAEGGVSPQRLERWLRADPEEAWRQAPRLLERIGEAGVNWVAAAYLLRDWDERRRTEVARDFFRSRRTADTQGA